MTCSAERSCATTHGVVGIVIYESLADWWGFLSKAAEYVGNMKNEPASKTAGTSGMSTQLKQRLTQAGVKERWARHDLNQLSLPLKCNFKQVYTDINKQSASGNSSDLAGTFLYKKQKTIPVSYSLAGVLQGRSLSCSPVGSRYSQHPAA